MVKRKASSLRNEVLPAKKGKTAGTTAPAREQTVDDVKGSFRPGLFDDAVLKEHTDQYAGSGPYKHCVIAPLIDDALLRAVRKEILDNISFTPKETDIYRIHQSGDLTNISGLPAAQQKKLSSVKDLRDALYSKPFRAYVAALTGCGALSGSKTDMAINVYTPGCHLLTHDDVIGSRRVSYILYLTDPDEPWQPAWGGALRLYPTEAKADAAGAVTHVPSHSWCKVIPPSWNQLSFFEVVPGYSFHDVEEVFDGPEPRIRMAISGWFHIPQKGEEGYVAGLEEELAKKSSLQSLQTKADVFDRPQPQVVAYDDAPAPAEQDGAGKGKSTAPAADDEESDEDKFSAAELDFLLKFIAPTYLTPDTLEQMSDAFAEESQLSIDGFLRPPFAKALREHIEKADAKPSDWPVAVPPHKHRFLFLQPGQKEADGPLKELVDELFPSREFKKLLQLATGLKIKDRNILARRFRRELDYTLATSFGDDSKGGEGEGDGAGEQMRLELCLGLTPTSGWGGDEEEDEEGADGESADKAGSSKANGSSKTNGASSSKSKPPPKANGKAKPEAPQRPSKFDDSSRTVGGYEMYMSADDDGDDPAIYKASGDDEDDGVLFTNPASWNRLSIVLRDAGVLKFVKYVSKSAQGDRWDIVGEFGVEPSDDDEENEEDADEEDADEEGADEQDADEEDDDDEKPKLEDGDDGEEWAGIKED